MEMSVCRSVTGLQQPTYQDHGLGGGLGLFPHWNLKHDGVNMQGDAEFIVESLWGKEQAFSAKTTLSVGT
jgi:hypothetical protein